MADVLEPPVHICTSANDAGEATRRSPAPPTIPISQHQLVTPLRPLEFERELADHPDKAFTKQLLRDIREGFDIGYQGARYPLTTPNLPSAYRHPEVIDAALLKECEEGRMAGPYSTKPFQNLRCSGMGAIPKKDGGWRVICHLSAPAGRSVK